jgi:hypothetical protein
LFTSSVRSRGFQAAFGSDSADERNNDRRFEAGVSCDGEFPEHITGGFTKYCYESAPRTCGARVGTWSNIDLNALVREQFADAEDVICVADSESAMHPIHAHDDAHALCGLGRIRALGFGYQTVFRDTPVDEIVAAHAPLTKAEISPVAASRNDDGSVVAREQVVGVIEPGTKDR